MKGLFHLKSYRHLVAKLRHDFERLKRDHVDAYAAFDFFVTANDGFSPRQGTMLD